jgi:hypothetical protein
MSAQRRQKRFPISCEPCRVRKIRCSRPRGPPPCETCVRRSLTSDCIYASRNEASPHPRPLLPPSPLSNRSASTVSQSEESLAARVAKLESMLQAQSAPVRVRPSSALPACVARSKGSLIVSESGHVRFTPFEHGQSSDGPLHTAQQTTAGSIDLSSGPFPFGRRQVAIRDLLTDLPGRNHCTQLKDVYFASFAPVSNTHSIRDEVHRLIYLMSSSISSMIQHLMNSMRSSSKTQSQPPSLGSHCYTPS